MGVLRVFEYGVAIPKYSKILCIVYTELYRFDCGSECAYVMYVMICNVRYIYHI